MTKLLFVCSRNQWRSPTAERIWRRQPGIQARSAGISPQARRRLNQQDIAWADMILVMEKKHKQRILLEFGDLLINKSIHILDIPDEYQYMDPELIEQLTVTVASILAKGE